eukprot:2590397-Amphidinium_carterae.1
MTRRTCNMHSFLDYGIVWMATLCVPNASASGFEFLPVILINVFGQDENARFSSAHSLSQPH